ncbi:MAG: thiamine pyrophosphate-dependent enzyme, partial [Thermoproteota archaeon]|nr:thiamine pyrophosphate-dependent enzyme [Thermoproteota archaeon]
MYNIPIHRKSIKHLLQKRGEEEQANGFLKSSQEAMKKWKQKLNEQIRSHSITDDDNNNRLLVKPQHVASVVSKQLDDNAIISVDSGTNTVWAARYIDIRKGMKFSVSGTLASMGCGLPYALAAQIAYPERQCVAFVGDGGFMMLMADFATAVQYNLPIKVIVLKNNTLGMIRWEQMGFLGNPEFGVTFSPIDFAKFAEDCGGKGYVIKEPSEVKSTIMQAMKERNKPTIVEAYIDPFEPLMPPKAEPDFIRKIS